MRKLVSQILLGGFVLLSGHASRAEAPGPGVLPVQVIAIQSDDADDQAEALTGAIRSRVRTLKGYSLQESDFALEVLTLGFKCPELPDEACQAKIGDHIHAERYVWGTVRRSKSHRQVAADLHLWTRGRPPARTQLKFSDNLTAPGDEALKRLVEEALAKLLDPVGAASSGAPAAGAPTASPAASSLSIARAAAPRFEATTPGSTDAIDESAGNGHRTAGWAATGLGGALIAAGVYSVVRLHAIDTDPKVQHYREGFHSSVDVCDAANGGAESKVSGAASPTEMRDFCSSGTTFQTLQYIFFGLGAVSAGAGIYLLATDKGAPTATTSKLRVTPSVGRAGGRLDVTFSF